MTLCRYPTVSWLTASASALRPARASTTARLTSLLARKSSYSAGASPSVAAMAMACSAAAMAWSWRPTALRSWARSFSMLGSSDRYAIGSALNSSVTMATASSLAARASAAAPVWLRALARFCSALARWGRWVPGSAAARSRVMRTASRSSGRARRCSRLEISRLPRSCRAAARSPRPSGSVAARVRQWVTVSSARVRDSRMGRKLARNPGAAAASASCGSAGPNSRRQSPASRSSPSARAWTAVCRIGCSWVASSSCRAV